MPSRLTGVRLAARRELRDRWRDRSTVLAALTVAVVLPLLLTAAIGRGAGADYRPTIVLVQPAGSAAAKAVVETLRSRRDLGLETVVAGSEADARALLRAGRGDAAVVLAGDGRAAAMTLRSKVLAGDVAHAIARSVNDRAAAYAAAVTATAGSAASGDATSRSAEGPMTRGVVDLRLADLDRRAPSPLAYFAPSLTFLMAFFVCGASARSLAGVRTAGVGERWLSASTPRWALDAGVGLGATALAVAVSLVAWAVSLIVFRTSWGPAAGVLPLIVANAFAASAWNLALLRVAGRSDNRIDGASAALVLVLGLFGGHFVPLHQLPAVFRHLARLTPSGWSLPAFSDMTLLGAGASTAWPAAGIVTGMGLAAAWLALAGTRRAVPA